MKHPMQEMMEKRRQGIKCGIPSYCSANELVLETALRRAKLLDQPVLIEATANQVNQYGGYTGMLPKDFYKLVLDMAAEIGLPEQMVILAGDHLGPLISDEKCKRCTECVGHFDAGCYMRKVLCIKRT